jgi:predicted kinase
MIATIMPELVLIRGLPGSGKSTLARAMRTTHAHVEADMYFTVNGFYFYNSAWLQRAHDWCQRAAEAALEAGCSVVVANTFTRNIEMRPYADMARRCGASLRVIEATGDWPNVHNVPPAAIKRMRARWEPLDATIYAARGKE